MDSAKKSAVVTGATGMIGIALIKKLLQENYTVYAVIRPSSPRTANLPVHRDLHIIECDLNNYHTLHELIPGKADMFFHLAWDGTYGDSRNDMHLQCRNTDAAVTAADAALKLGCSVFVGAGSQAEYGRCSGMISPYTEENPENGYGIAKLTAGRMTRIICRKNGIKHIWCRILSVYGPFDSERSMVMSGIISMLKGENPLYTKGEQEWDYLYCDDAAEALFLSAEKGQDGSVYCIGSGRTRLLKDYIYAIRDAAAPDCEPQLGAIPYFENQVMYLCADISSLTADTGFTPSVSFEEGIKRTVEHYRNLHNQGDRRL